MVSCLICKLDPHNANYEFASCDAEKGFVANGCVLFCALHSRGDCMRSSQTGAARNSSCPFCAAAVECFFVRHCNLFLSPVFSSIFPLQYHRMCIHVLHSSSIFEVIFVDHWMHIFCA